jgi:hypothetical protein
MSSASVGPATALGQIRRLNPNLQLDVPKDNFKKGAKEQDNLDLTKYLAVSSDLRIFGKWLEQNDLAYTFESRKAPGKEDTKWGMFVYLEDEEISDDSKLAAYHIHVIFKKGDKKRWRITALLPKESNFRQKKELPLIGSPSDWYDQSAQYEEDRTKELVRKFSMAVAAFKLQMAQYKARQEDPEEEICLEYAFELSDSED